VLGDELGLSLGEVLGVLLGLALGAVDGVLLGLVLGPGVGEELGLLLGPTLGSKLGDGDGSLLGSEDGLPVGPGVGEELGLLLGKTLGTLDGDGDGSLLGSEDGLPVGPGVGEELGSSSCLFQAGHGHAPKCGYVAEWGQWKQGIQYDVGLSVQKGWYSCETLPSMVDFPKWNHSFPNGASLMLRMATSTHFQQTAGCSLDLGTIRGHYYQYGIHKMPALSSSAVHAVTKVFA
jgi:hypothetical protein